MMAAVLCLTPGDEDVLPSPIATPPRYLAIAHRGAPLHHAENTIPALEAAADIGAEAVEVDLCITSDDHVVLWHDVDPSSLRATARQIGIGPVPHDPDAPFLGSEHRERVAELTLEELRTHYGYDETDVTIPTLSQLFEWLASRPEIEVVFLDIKDDDRVIAILEHVVRAIAGRSLNDRVFYALNTTPSGVEEMKAVLADHPGLPVRPMVDGTGSLLATARDLGVRHVSLGRRVWEPMPLFVDNLEELLRARRRGELDTVVVWTFDERHAQRLLYELGVDGIMSNQVERLVDVRDSMDEETRRDASR